MTETRIIYFLGYSCRESDKQNGGTKDNSNKKVFGRTKRILVTMFDGKRYKGNFKKRWLAKKRTIRFTRPKRIHEEFKDIAEKKRIIECSGRIKIILRELKILLLWEKEKQRIILEELE